MIGTLIGVMVSCDTFYTTVLCTCPLSETVEWTHSYCAHMIHYSYATLLSAMEWRQPSRTVQYDLEKNSYIMHAQMCICCKGTTMAVRMPVNAKIPCSISGHVHCSNCLKTLILWFHDDACYIFFGSLQWTGQLA